jgi:hypothetical protein
MRERDSTGNERSKPEEERNGVGGQTHRKEEKRGHWKEGKWAGKPQ